jgi:hypothetical protein
VLPYFGKEHIQIQTGKKLNTIDIIRVYRGEI